MRVQIYWVRDNRGNELFLRDGHAFVAQLVEDSPGSCGIVVDFCGMQSHIHVCIFGGTLDRPTDRERNSSPNLQRKSARARICT